MPFQFHSRHVQNYLETKRPGVKKRSLPPGFVEDALVELGESIRPLELQSDRSVRQGSRSYTETCELVDWAAAIWRKCFDSTLTVERLVLNHHTRQCATPRDDFFAIFDYWHEFDEPGAPIFLPGVRYPHPYLKNVPSATVGNLCAAFGMAILDRLLMRQRKLSVVDAMAELGAAWQCAAFAGRHNHLAIWAHLQDFPGGARSS